MKELQQGTKITLNKFINAMEREIAINKQLRLPAFEIVENEEAQQIVKDISDSLNIIAIQLDDLKFYLK